jgi:hypothetical protein
MEHAITTENGNRFFIKVLTKIKSKHRFFTTNNSYSKYRKERKEKQEKYFTREEINEYNCR